MNHFFSIFSQLLQCFTLFSFCGVQLLDRNASVPYTGPMTKRVSIPITHYHLQEDK
jgi:hypothetical protein